MARTSLDYLAAQDDLRAFPYLADIARLEQIWRVAYHEADAPLLHPATFEGLSDADLMKLCFARHPAAALLQSGFAVHAIFTANRDGGDGVVAEPGRAEWVLVTRPYYEVQLRSISASQHVLFAALMSGASLGEAAEQALASSDEFDLAASIRLMLEAGAFQSTAI